VTSPPAPRFRRLAVALVAAAGVGVVMPATASAAPRMVVPPRPFVPAVSPSVAIGPASTYHSVTPFAAYRSKGRIAAHHVVSLSLAGAGPLPAAGRFAAVAVSVTVTRPTTSTAAEVFAPHASAITPAVSVAAKGVATGFTMVPVDAAGRLRARLTKGSAALRIDVVGYQSPDSSGETFHPLATANLLRAHRVAAGGTRRISVVGATHTGLPSNGRIAAVALAVTASRPTVATTVTAYPRGSRASTSPVVSVRSGGSESGVTVVAVGSHGDVMLRNTHGHATLRADVEGYWTKDPTGSRFHSVTPSELYAGTTVANAWRNIRVATRGGVPRVASAGGVVLSITTGSASTSATMTVAPTTTGFPTSGPINVAAHHPATTAVLTRLTGADVHVYASRRLPITVSVIGWYGVTASGVDVNAGVSSCDSGPSSAAAFAVIRATNGLPYNSSDPACFGGDVARAQNLPAAPQFYMNLADPGRASKGHWDNGGPKACHTAHNYDAGCAYDYGYLAASQAVGFARAHGMSAGSRWWIDVETDNSWGSATVGSPGHLASNVADIQGALHYFAGHSFPAGIYTETAWWTVITGSSKAFSQTPVWGGGAGSVKNARANCKSVSITGGPALLAQWFKDKNDDHDVSC
jgi:hypothetical protein